MNKYPSPFNHSDKELKIKIKELIDYRVKIKLEVSVINYEELPNSIKIQDDKEMELLNLIICEYLEEYVYKRGLAF